MCDVPRRSHLEDKKPGVTVSRTKINGEDTLLITSYFKKLSIFPSEAKHVEWIS